MDNAAFEEYPEIELRKILNSIPSKFIKLRAHSEDCLKLYDINGNAVGTFVGSAAFLSNDLLDMRRMQCMKRL
jgi:hypothetical protein